MSKVYVDICMSLICINYANMQISIPGCTDKKDQKRVQNLPFLVTVKRLLTYKISSTCLTGLSYISKYAGNFREKSHEESE